MNIMCAGVFSSSFVSCLSRSSLTVSVCLSDVCLPVCVDCTQISDSQFLRAVCVQPTVEKVNLAEL